MVEADHGGWTGITDLPAKRWVLVTGNRIWLSVLFAVLLAVLTAILIGLDIVYVGSDSMLSTVLASGMLGGLATIVTVTLSINQLILSRVFGAPADLTDRLEGNLSFRRSIEEVAGVESSPNDPGSFLSLIARTLERRAGELNRTVQQSTAFDEDTKADVQSFSTNLVDYAQHLDSARNTDSTFEVLSLTFGTEYADRIDDARHIKHVTDDQFTDETGDSLDAILTLLKGVATIRQFFKTLAVQQDLARLSRHLIYTGVPAILTAFFLATVYAGAEVGTTLSPSMLPVVVVGATMILFSPLLVLVSYLLRVATVTLYTVSVGSFIPPEERVDRN